MKIGDKVKIKKFGHVYTTYIDKFIEMGFKNPDEEKDINKSEFRNTIFTIFAKGKHGNYDMNLFGIVDENGNQFLFSRKGLKHIRKDDTYQI